jgi:hypothetical protein
LVKSLQQFCRAAATSTRKSEVLSWWAFCDMKLIDVWLWIFALSSR